MNTSLVARLTQRLDHMVPDTRVTAAVNLEASEKLRELSERLAKALPDSSLSPDERLERLARVVEERIPKREHLLPALEKVRRLEQRLEELVPTVGLSAVERLETLLGRCEQCVPDDSLTLVQKLEKMGDPRAGISPVL